MRGPISHGKLKEKLGHRPPKVRPLVKAEDDLFFIDGSRVMIRTTGENHLLVEKIVAECGSEQAAERELRRRIEEKKAQQNGV